jgi:hypothetical protein
MDQRPMHKGERYNSLKTKGLIFMTLPWQWLFRYNTRSKSSPTTDEWVKKMWYLYTMEFYSALRKTGMSFAGKWVELENIILSEVSQAQKVKGHVFSLTCGI